MITIQIEAVDRYLYYEILYILKENPTSDILLNIDSAGGDPREALRINKLLSNHNGRIYIHIQMYCLSAATLILAVANPKDIVITSYGMVMIHEVTLHPESLQEGDGASYDKISKTLNDSAAKIYSNILGVEQEQVRELMKKTTWYTAEEALQIGWVGAIEQVNYESKLSKDVIAQMYGIIPSKMDFQTKTNQQTVSSIENKRVNKMKEWLKHVSARMKWPESTDEVGAAIEIEKMKNENDRLTSSNQELSTRITQLESQLLEATNKLESSTVKQQEQANSQVVAMLAEAVKSYKITADRSKELQAKYASAPDQLAEILNYFEDGLHKPRSLDEREDDQHENKYLASSNPQMLKELGFING